MQDLFNTEQKRAEAISAFTELLNHPGWKLLEQILDIDIERLREELETIKEEPETKEEIDFQRYKLAFCKEQRNKPKQMIEKLKSTEDVIPDPDPFPTVESLKKQRGEVA
jgi:hypothetical protein